MDDTNEAKLASDSDIDMSHHRLGGRMLCVHGGYPLECLQCLRAEIVRLRQMVMDETVARGKAEGRVERLTVELDEVCSTIKSLAVMLGWANVPPRSSLEMTISSNRKRLENAEAEADGLKAQLAAAKEKLMACHRIAWPRGGDLNGDPECDLMLMVGTFKCELGELAEKLTAAAGKSTKQARVAKRLQDALESIRKYVREMQPILKTRAEFNDAFRVLNESIIEAKGWW